MKREICSLYCILHNNLLDFYVNRCLKNNRIQIRNTADLRDKYKPQTKVFYCNFKTNLGNCFQLIFAERPETFMNLLLQMYLYTYTHTDRNFQLISFLEYSFQWLSYVNVLRTITLRNIFVRKIIYCFA